MSIAKAFLSPSRARGCLLTNQTGSTPASADVLPAVFCLSRRRSGQIGKRDAAEELAADIDLEHRGGDDNAEVDGLLIEIQQLLEDTSCKSALTLGAFSPRSSTLTAVPEESAASFYTHRTRAGVQ